ncbi:MAG: rhodanese-like domain-containing protein [Acidobacteria bacterium]|nr:rhodanese-like domain-containing protein [Acidobacteriota bacterium]
MIGPITPQDLERLVANGLADSGMPGGRVHVFDLRDAASFVAGHIPGARHLPHEDNYPLRWVPQQCHTQELVVLVDQDGAVGGLARARRARLGPQVVPAGALPRRGARRVDEGRASARVRGAVGWSGRVVRRHEGRGPSLRVRAVGNPDGSPPLMAVARNAPPGSEHPGRA